MSTKIKIRILFLAIYLIIFGFFVISAIIPSGHKSYIFDFNKESSFISQLSPDERIKAGEKNYENLIIGNPVYFNLYTPRKFDTAKLKIKFKNENKLPIIEAGILADKKIWRYQLKPVQNILLDQFSLIWDKSYDKDLLFLQNTYSTTTPIFKSINDLLKSTTDLEEIAVYNTQLDYTYKINDYKADQEQKVVDIGLSGSYQLFTYIKDEELNFSFDFTNLSQDKNSDNKIIALLYYDSIILDSKEIELQNFKDKGSISIITLNLLEGAYKIEIKAGDKVVTEKINTKQKKISFKNKLNFSKENKTDIVIFTDGNNLQAQTVYPESLQSIKVGDTNFSLSETYKQYNWQIYDLSSTTLKTVYLSNDGIDLSSDGYFSINKESYFNPDLKKVNYYLKNNINSTNYIIADYSSPDYISSFFTKEINFNLNIAYRENSTYSFIISIPDLHLGESGASVEIENIEIELEGDNLLELLKKVPSKIKKIVINYF